MQAVRILLTVAVVVGAGFLAFRGLQGPAKPPEPAFKAPPLPDMGTLGTGGPLIGTVSPVPQDPKSAPPPPEPDPVILGTPVAADAVIDVRVPYRTGTKSRYRVEESQLLTDQDTSAQTWWRMIWGVSAEVVQGDGTGPARLRFQVDSFRFHTYTMGQRIDFDSEHPDKTLLDDPALNLARTLKPLLATLAVPVGLVIDASGAVHSVEGAEALTRKFVEEVDKLSAKAARVATDAPSPESVQQKWTEFLFPPLGGGTLRSGEAREIAFRTTFPDLERWGSLTSGRVRVTHDDPDAFRVEFKGTPVIEELNRPVRGEAAAAVEKVRIDASADSTVASWRFDRKAGRLLESTLHSRYRIVVGRRAGVDERGQPIYSHPYTWVERSVRAVLLDK